MENLENEIWKDIPTYEGYYKVSNLGRIISVRYGKEKLMSQPISNGYYTISLKVKCKHNCFRSHQLIAMAFLNHVPCGSVNVVNHIDGNRLNNNLSNLEIVTQRENTGFCFRSDRHTFSSQHYGVFFCKNHKRWVSRIQIKGKNIHLGNYKKEQDASIAYNKALDNLDNPTYFDSLRSIKSSKYKGVSYRKDNGKWRSFCLVDKKQKNIGTFTTQEEAYNALQSFLKTKI